MNTSAVRKTVQKIKEPKNLSARITWLRNYYFQGTNRAWNNEFSAWSTGTPWDVQFDEMTFYIVLKHIPSSNLSASLCSRTTRPVKIHPDFLVLEPART